MAQLLTEISKTKENEKQAKELVRKACKLKSGEGCYKRWKEQSDAQKDKPKRSKKADKRWKKYEASLGKKIRSYLQKSCNNKEQAIGKDCFLLGYLRYEGKLLARNMKRARQLIQKSCELHYPEGCDFYAIMLGNGIGGHKDLKQARVIHKKACDLGSTDGCVHLGGLMFRGLGGVKQMVSARRLFRESCVKKHPQACLLLGEMLLRGEGGDRDLRAGLKRYEEACRYKQMEACKRAQELRKYIGK